MASDILTEGLYFPEDPRWRVDRLWFSDFYDHAVKTIDLDGKVEVQVEVPDQPSGLGWLPDGRLLIVSMVDRKVLRLDPEGLVEHADLSGIATFHCNDMLVDPKGNAYVTNFGFDLDALLERGEGKACQSHLTLVRPDGSVEIAAPDLDFPNGMALTPDGRTLIVAESMGLRLRAFTVAEDATLHDSRVFADLRDIPAAPDGICLDAEGAVWLANAIGASCVRVAEGGDVLDTVETSQPCYACALGGTDGRTLYLCTASGSSATKASEARTGRIESVRVDVPAAPQP
jgi:sugar lactone lactonase YvrE